MPGVAPIGMSLRAGTARCHVSGRAACFFTFVFRNVHRTRGPAAMPQDPWRDRSAVTRWRGPKLRRCGP